MNCFQVKFSIEKPPFYARNTKMILLLSLLLPAASKWLINIARSAINSDFVTPISSKLKHISRRTY